MISSTNFDCIWENQFSDFVYLLQDRITIFEKNLLTNREGGGNLLKCQASGEDFLHAADKAANNFKYWNCFGKL